MLVWPDHTGVVLARLVSSLLSALVLAAAVATAIRLRSRLLVAGVILTATPMAVNLSGSVNPNGIEIAAGVLLFTNLVALVRGVVDRRLLVLTGIAAAIMLTVRQLGPALLVADVAAVVLLAGWAKTATLLRVPNVRRILGASVLAGALFTLVWTLVSGGPDTAPIAGRGIRGSLVHPILTERVPFYLHQLVGQFGYGDTTISRYAIDFWYLLWAVVVIPALVWGGWRLRLVLAGLAAFSAALLVALDLHFAPLNGWFAQGRYALPVLVGVVLLAALSERGPARWLALQRSRRLPVALVVATAPVQLYALARVMTRYQTGRNAALDPFGGQWLPPGGPVLPLVALAVGVILLVVTQSYVAVPAVMVSEGLDNGSVTQQGRSASYAEKASTTDVASH